MKKRTLLLTGGSGMVGRNILDDPKAMQWNILAPSSSQLDLTNLSQVLNFLTTFKPDIIIHAAGQVGGIQANVEKPILFLDRNIVMGRNIIMAAYQLGIPNFLNLASTCMYPRAVDGPLLEEMILTGELEPTNEGYALAKIFTTRLCQYINNSDNKYNYKTIIPCNLFGKYDNFDPNSSHLLPAIIQKIHNAKINSNPTVEIWGDGTARREFMLARDLADAVLLAASDIEILPDLMNCGVGYDHSIETYYRTVAEVIEWNGNFSYNLNKPVGMKRKLCSIDRQAKWGWHPQTSLHDGIKEAYNFYLNTYC